MFDTWCCALDNECFFSFSILFSTHHSNTGLSGFIRHKNLIPGLCGFYKIFSDFFSGLPALECYQWFAPCYEPSPSWIQIHIHDGVIWLQSLIISCLSSHQSSWLVFMLRMFFFLKTEMILPLSILSLVLHSLPGLLMMLSSQVHFFFLKM